MMSKVFFSLVLLACFASLPANGQNSTDPAPVVDPCVSSPCLNSALCVASSETTYVCLCAPNYTGETCQTYSPGSDWYSSLGYQIGGAAAGGIITFLLIFFVYKFVRPRLCPAQNVPVPVPVQGQGQGQGQAKPKGVELPAALTSIVVSKTGVELSADQVAATVNQEIVLGNMDGEVKVENPNRNKSSIF